MDVAFDGIGERAVTFLNDGAAGRAGRFRRRRDVYPRRGREHRRDSDPVAGWERQGNRRDGGALRRAQPEGRGRVNGARLLCGDTTWRR